MGELRSQAFDFWIVVKISFMKTAPKLAKEEEANAFKKPAVPISKEFSESADREGKALPSTSKSVEKRKYSALDDILSMEEKNREKQNRKDYWLHKVRTITFNRIKGVYV